MNSPTPPLIRISTGDFVRPDAVLSIRIAKPGIILDLPDIRFLTIECAPERAAALAEEIAASLNAALK